MQTVFDLFNLLMQETGWAAYFILNTVGFLKEKKGRTKNWVCWTENKNYCKNPIQEIGDMDKGGVAKDKIFKG